MKHSYSEQISAIQKARTLLSGSIVAQPVILIEQLNDAASTIAAINFNPKIFERVKELEEVLKSTRKLNLHVYDKGTIGHMVYMEIESVLKK